MRLVGLAYVGALVVLVAVAAFRLQAGTEDPSALAPPDPSAPALVAGLLPTPAKGPIRADEQGGTEPAEAAESQERMRETVPPPAPRRRSFRRRSRNRYPGNTVSSHVGSTGRPALCASTLSGEVRGPVVHEPTSAVEQVRAPIGCLDPVLDHMCEGRFDDLARMIRLLGRPIAEAGAKPVGHGRDLVLPEHPAQLLLLELLAEPIGKQIRTGSLHQRPCPVRESPVHDHTAGPGARGSPSSA